MGGDRLDLKKYRSDAKSSVASETGASGASESEDTRNSAVLSETGETLSTCDAISTSDAISEPDTSVGVLSELDTIGETQSEMDSEVGDGLKVKKKGLKTKKRK